MPYGAICCGGCSNWNEGQGLRDAALRHVSFAFIIFALAGHFLRKLIHPGSLNGATDVSPMDGKTATTHGVRRPCLVDDERKDSSGRDPGERLESNAAGGYLI
jgi:hypothetical protein